MDSVREHAPAGGLGRGICNGFQILLEMGLLPGVMLVNRQLQFICRDVFLKVENTSTPFTSEYRPDAVITFPIAHGMGNYFAEPATVERLERNHQVVLRYCDARGQ